jgi:hypothetical protein
MRTDNRQLVFHIQLPLMLPIRGRRDQHAGSSARP